MKVKAICLLGLAGLLVTGCQDKKDKKKDVVAQRYIHKYGYDISRDEWNSNQYPGQVVTTLKNGVCVSSTYEGGVLHGKTTYTFPHSQTLESLHVYERGNLVKKISYDIKGMPTQEETFLSPSHVKTKYWFKSGTPKCVEEVIDNTLVEGEYFTLNNETEAKVENGTGSRMHRSSTGTLLSKEIFQDGELIGSETYHPNGTPHVTLTMKNGKLNGDKHKFSETGEPIYVESYVDGQLNGLCTYYQNGYRYKETPYVKGIKHGVERQFVDGETLIEETEYHGGQKHGPSTFYCEGIARSDWFYNDEKVTKAKFEELLEREKVISIMHDRSKHQLDEMALETEEEQEEL